MTDPKSDTVKRYEYSLSHGVYIEMQDGSFVCYEDYTALQQQAHKWALRIEELLIERTGLQQQLARVVEERDRLKQMVMVNTWDDYTRGYEAGKEAAAQVCDVQARAWGGNHKISAAARSVEAEIIAMKIRALPHPSEEKKDG